MASDGKKYEEKYGLDISMNEAMKRFGKATKEDLEDKAATGTDLVPEGECELVLFKDVEIRKVFHESEWWFSIVDVVGALTESSAPRRYWAELKAKMLKNEGFNESLGEIEQLKMPASDGKFYAVDAATTETLLRIIQSVPSPRAEPFKRWLAKVGYERIQEIQNPEIAIKRAILSYQIQGRSDDWIEKRIRSIVARKELTNEWKKRGIADGKEYAALTNVISANTFGGVTVDGHKRVKGLKASNNLRDHMTDLELIFTMLGEKSTTEIAKARDAQGYSQNLIAAKSGGVVAGTARQQLERETGERVVSSKNFLAGPKRVADPELLTRPRPKR